MTAQNDFNDQFQASQLMGLTAFAPISPGMMLVFGLPAFGVFLVGVTLLFLFKETARSLIEDARWYRWLVGYFFVVGLGLGATMIYWPSWKSAAIAWWIVSYFAAYWLVWDRLLQAVRTYRG